MKDAKRDEETVRKWKSNYERATQKGNAKKAMTEYESLTTNVSLDCKVASSENDLMAEDLPQNIEDYIDKLVMPHTAKTRCDHSLVWGGWTTFHPLNQLRQYTSADRDDKGMSKACIHFQLKMEICDQIDLAGPNVKQVFKLLLFDEFEGKTLHLFPLYLMEQQIDFLRERCYKLSISGPAHHDGVALNKMFRNIPCALGLWKNFGRGIIMFKSNNTFFAFIPKDTEEFFKFLSFDNEMSIVEPLVGVFSNIFMEKIHDRADNHEKINKILKSAGFPEFSKNHILYGLYAFGALKMIHDKEQLVDMFKINGVTERKFDQLMLQTKRNGEDFKERLYSITENGCTRWTPKHNSGCGHKMDWSGMMIFNEMDCQELWSKWMVTGLAYRCECVTHQAGVYGSDKVDIPLEFWRILPQRLDVLLLPGKESVKVVDYKMAVLVFEIGSIHKRVIDFIRDKRNLAISCLGSSSNTADIKYIIQYFFSEIDKKVFGKIFTKRNSALETRIEELKASGCKNITKILADSVLFNTKVPRSEREVKEKAKIHWAGDMFSFFNGTRAVGHNASENLIELALTDHREAKNAIEEECLGSLRGGSPYQPCSGLFVFSNYIAFTSNKPAPHHIETIFSKARDSSACFIALDVERKIVENIIGSYKKCFTFQVTIHDDNYITKELRDCEKKMLGFFLQLDESVQDVLKMSPSEATKRLLILKYDTKDNITIACVPKEKEKMEQIWKNYCKTPSFQSHEKMLKKLRKQEEATTVNLKTVIEADADGCKVDSVEVISIQSSKQSNKAKKKKDLGARPKETEKQKLEDDLSNNLKKMFPQPSKVEPEPEPEKEKAGGSNVQDNKKVCWNCLITDVKLLKCQACRKARYCSRQCQEHDWERHQQRCQVKEKKKKDDTKKDDTKKDDTET